MPCEVDHFYMHDTHNDQIVNTETNKIHCVVQMDSCMIWSTWQLQKILGQKQMQFLWQIGWRLFMHVEICTATTHSGIIHFPYT